MQREIKFRVQRSDTKEWLYFTLGDLAGCLDVSTVEKGYDYIADTWCEYTGLHDKNGKEIYEGDIIKSNDGVETHKHVVTMGVNGVAFDSYHLWDTTLEDKEIIGNIYENPELLNPNE